MVTRGRWCSVEGNRELFAARDGELANWLVTAATQSGRPLWLRQKAEFACVSVTLPLSKPLHVNEIITVGRRLPGTAQISFNNADDRVQNFFGAKKKKKIA